MQGVTRNPLAEPGLLGVNAGAALAVVGAIFLLGIDSPREYVWFAFLGAGLAAAAVHSLGSGGRDAASPVRLVLAGAVMSSLLVALTSAILVIDVDTLDQYRFWVVGSLAGRDLSVLADVAPFMVAGIAIALLSGRSLGQRVGLTRGLAALAVVLLAGASVAAAGPIAFVGLAVPQGVRMIVGADWRWVLAYSAAVGPILLIGSDILGRVVARPGEVQVGVMTALIGAPVFVLLARRRRPAAA